MAARHRELAHAARSAFLFDGRNEQAAEATIPGRRVYGELLDLGRITIRIQQSLDRCIGVTRHDTVEISHKKDVLSARLYGMSERLGERITIGFLTYAELRDKSKHSIDIGRNR